jgi:hypothetical protein
MSQTTVFKFSNDAKNNWMVVNDGVMGGISKSKIEVDNNGIGVFSGTVRLENNGGFASVRHTVKKVDLSEKSKFIIIIKGDGKVYQFRCKSNLYDRQSYVFEFKTTGDWQEIEVPFAEMYPRYRGYKLDMPNYEGETLAEIAFLIGNKKPENFKLEIDSISVD